MKYFKTYTTFIYILLSGIESSFWTPYTCLAFQQKHIHQNSFKHLRWSVFACPVNDFKPFGHKKLFSHKNSILDAWRGSEYACAQIAPNNVLCHHNKRLMKYFKFLYGSGIICLLLNIPEKLHWQHLFEKPEKVETHRFYLSSFNTISTHPEEQHLPLKQTGTTTIVSFDTNPVFGHVMIHSFDKTHFLVVTMELIWLFFLNIFYFNFVLTPNKFLIMLTRFRRSWVKHPFAILTSHTSYTAFLLDIRCAVQSDHAPFLQPFVPNLCNLFLLNTPLAQLLLTPRWVSR